MVSNIAARRRFSVGGRIFNKKMMAICGILLVALLSGLFTFQRPGEQAVSAYPGTLDTDGDGVDDFDDLDDDNDGIADVDEGLDIVPSGSTGALDTSQVTFNITSAAPTVQNTEHVLDSITVSATATIDGTHGVFSFPDSYEVDIVGTLPQPNRFVESLQGVIQGNASDPTWNDDVIDAFQSTNLNHFQRLDGTTQYQSDDVYRLTFEEGIAISGTSMLLVTERGGNNAAYVDAYDLNDNLIGTFVVDPTDYVDTGHRADNFQNIFIAVFPVDVLGSLGRMVSYFEIRQTDTGFVIDGADGKVLLINRAQVNTDTDTDYDNLDLDSDNDGIADIYEAGNATVSGYDTNGDGTISLADGFIDDGSLGGVANAGNGLDDRIENLLGTADRGVIPLDSFNTVGDDAADVYDLDSDDDGIPDATEARATTDYVAYPATIDGSSDSDRDGILDIFDSDGSSAAGPGTFGSTSAAFKTLNRLPYADSDDDADTTPDYLDLDSDADGLLDSDPEESGTVAGVLPGDPDGNVDNPLTSGVLDNDDLNGTGVDVDFRSINNPMEIDLVAPAQIVTIANQSSYPVSGTCSQDDDLIEIYVDGTDVTPVSGPTCTAGTFSFNVDLSPISSGTNLTIEARVVDDGSVFPTKNDIESIDVDGDPPVITLTGADPQVINQGDTYTELGATASDIQDGDITANIVTDSSSVDTNTLGTYTVTYNVADATGNVAIEAMRTVTVIKVGDNDGLPDDVEDQSPNSGDFNNDGILDSTQSNVASIVGKQTDSSGHIGIAVYEDAGFTSLSTTCPTIDIFDNHAETEYGSLDADHRYPIGLFYFKLACQNPGNGAYVRITLDQDYSNHPEHPISTWSERKFTGAPGLVGAYIDHDGGAFRGYGTVNIAGVSYTTIDLYVVDGDNFDVDGQINGEIVDPTGPALDVLAETGDSIFTRVIIGMSLVAAAMATAMLSKKVKRRMLYSHYQ